jgi:hypothetical protein
MHCTTIVDDGLDWRMPRKASAMALSTSKVLATRWFAGNEQAQEFIAETPADCDVVKIAPFSHGSERRRTACPRSSDVRWAQLPMAPESSHRLCRRPARSAREPRRRCFVGRAHTHAFCSAISGRHGSAASRISLAPSDRAGSRYAPRNWYVIGGCGAISRVPNPGTLHQRFQTLRGAAAARVARIPWRLGKPSSSP